MGWIEAEAQFITELKRLTTSFTKNLALYRSSVYDEASVRIDYLNPFFRALGWDLENSTSAAQSLREVQIETRVSIGGTKKRADYMFRTNGIDRLIFEAKAPHVTLTKKEAYQAQRYAFNLKLLPSTLGNFEVLQFSLSVANQSKTHPGMYVSNGITPNTSRTPSKSRLLTQVERILKVNQSEIVSEEIVTAARDSPVIGQG